MILATGGVACVGVNNLTILVHNINLRGELHIHGTLEVAILVVEQGVVAPTVALCKRASLCGETSIVGRHSHYTEVGLLNPIEIDIVDSVELADAGFASHSPEGDNHRGFAIHQLCGVNNLTLTVFNFHRGNLSHSSGRNQQHQGCKKHLFHSCKK